jgi:putative DNA primase/helicase
MREDFWDFTPSHSIVMHTNHRPIVRGNDEGIWRRLRFVPFNVVIPAAERDRELAGRLALEAAGVLGWIINGYRQWQSAGLASPPPVEAATSEFREESDMLGLFLDERCVIGRKSHVRSAELFAEWVAWCKGENAPAGKQTTFSLELSGRGFDKQRDNRGYVWQGIGLKADEWLS